MAEIFPKAEEKEKGEDPSAFLDTSRFRDRFFIQRRLTVHMMDFSYRTNSIDLENMVDLVWGYAGGVNFRWSRPAYHYTPQEMNREREHLIHILEMWFPCITH